MSRTLHDSLSHTHAERGPMMVAHEGHRDVLENGHLHFVHGNQVDEHRIPVSDMNPDLCTPGHRCDGHSTYHKHGPYCGHESVPHGDHTDYLVDGHLHHAHGDHCDFHGFLETA